MDDGRHRYRIPAADRPEARPQRRIRPFRPRAPACTDRPRSAWLTSCGIYGLTPTEARVLEFILSRHSSAEIAKAMSIAQSTLKWHTLQLFEKTGQHRRADLVRLAAQLRPAG